MPYDPSQNYTPGANTAGADGSFPVSGSSSTTTQDSVYGISKALASVPVRVTKVADPFTENQADKSAYFGEAPPQLMPWESTLALFYQMSPEDRAKIQQQMYEAGPGVFYPRSFYGSSKTDFYVPGEADSASYAAWQKVVESAVRSSTYDDKSGAIKNAKSIADVLDEAVQAVQQNPGGGASQPNPVRLTNPADLRAMAKAVGQKLIGRNPDPGFVDNYVAAYHAAEVAGAQPDEQGNVTSAPDAQTFAEQLLRQQYPVDVGVNDALNVGNELVNALAAPAGGGSLPTTRTTNG